MDKRINSIDILRGLAVVLMIFGHIYFRWPIINYLLFEESFNRIFLLVASFFLIISGMSFYLYVNQMICKKYSRNKIFIEVLKRATFIFIISTLIQVIFGFTLNLEISFIIYWSIFQVITFSMIVSFYIQFLKQLLRFFIYFILIILILILNDIIIFYDIDILLIMIKGDSFPFIPWSSYFIFGLFVIDLLHNFPYEKIERLIWIFMLLGVGSLIFYILFIIKLNLFIISLFLESISIFLVLFSLFYYFIDIKKFNFSILKMLIQWGKVAFSIYYIQFVLIIIGLMVFPLINGLLYLFIPFTLHFIIIILVFYFIIEIFLILWKKLNYKYGIEWLLNLISQKSLFVHNVTQSISKI